MSDPALTAIEKELLLLEKSTEAMDPDNRNWAAWLDEVREYTYPFLEHTRKGPAWEPYVAGATSVFSLEEEAAPLSAVLEDCHTQIDHRGLNPASGGHLGYIPGGGILPAALGDLLAAVTNRYSGMAFANPGAADLEDFLIRWMAALFTFPETSGGTLTSGGSIANLIAITAARDASGLRPAQWEKVVIYGSAQMHHCLHKALRIAGLGYATLREIPLDDQFRMQPHALARAIREDRLQGLHPFMIIGSAGTTDTGAIDPLDALADIAREEKIWFHIDAAYGGFFYLVPELRERLSGIGRADSLVIDPHKGLFLPYGTGAVLVRDIRHLLHSHFYQANYMLDAENARWNYSPADLSPELTRHFRGLRMYFALKMTGIGAIRACLREKWLLARRFHIQIGQLGFQTGPEPALSVCTFRYIPHQGDANTFNTRLMQALHEDGRVFLSSTTIDGQVWIRLSVLSFRSKRWHIDQALAMLAEKVSILQP